ncbi:hypothetical protein [Mycobacterium simiae]|uniref:TetR/AcrR family transcriptional regulator n=1 Tax=Mycobacterium simiae TaxID=1784 RepID=UPI000410CB7A|nr:hypothetical protein [Mycobacterium simiae]PLV54426.1 hypothetical protein X011_02865 [Mycobacterium tuberculosis variant microti OV254]
MAQLLGIAYLRYIVQIEPLASTPVSDLTARVIPVLDTHFGTPDALPKRKRSN